MNNNCFFRLKNETFGATVDKLGKAFNNLVTGSRITEFFKGLDYFSSLQKKPIKKLLLYGGKQEQIRSNGISILPWNKFI